MPIWPLNSIIKSPTTGSSHPWWESATNARSAKRAECLQTPMFVSDPGLDFADSKEQTLEIEGVPRGHVFNSPVISRRDGENPRPVLESLRKMLSDEPYWANIHKDLAETGPTLVIDFVRSESYVLKNSKMSGNPEMLPMRISVVILYEKVGIRALLSGKDKKMINN